MQFIQSTALALIEKYNLNPSVIHNWKKRQSIPDRYFKDNFVPKIKPEPALQSFQETIIKVLASGKINRPQFAALALMPAAKIHDVLVKRSSFSQAELQELKTVLDNLRLLIRSFFNMAAEDAKWTELKEDIFKRILNLPVWHLRSLSNNAPFYRRLLDYREGNENANLTQDQKDLIARELKQFLLDSAY